MSRAAELLPWVNQRLAALGHPPVDAPPRPKHAIVGVDGKKAAEHAAVWASQIAQRITLVTVLPNLSAFRSKPETQRSHQKNIEDLQHLASASRRRIREDIKDAKLDEATLKGSPSSTLIDACNERNASLLALGARNPRTETAPFGSVAETLMHHGLYSTLAARHPPEAAPIIAAVGDDDATRFAAAWAAALALWLDRPLRLVHSSLGIVNEETFEAIGPEAEAKISDWPPRFGFAQEFEGNPGALLVLGQESERSWMGSTAVALARSAICSVFLARPWSTP